jgi:hypothetical protein
MNNAEPTMKDLFGAVSSLSETISGMQEELTFVKDNALTKDYFHEHAVTKDYFLEHAVTKEYFHEHAVTKQELFKAKSEIMNSVDGFVQLHQKLDLELTSLTSKYQRLESYVQQIAKHVNLELT